MTDAGQKQAILELYQSARIAPTEAAFTAVMSQIEQVSPAMCDFIQQVPLESWAWHKLPVASFGTRTSNAVESFHSLYTWEKSHLARVPLIRAIVTKWAEKYVEIVPFS